MNTDSICFEVDTFNLVRKYFYKLNSLMDTGIFNYEYIHGRQIMSYYNTVEGSNCLREGFITPDSNGIIIDFSGTNNCFIPTNFSDNLLYDSIYRSISRHYYTDPNSNIVSEYTDFHYEDSDSIHVRYATMSELYSCFPVGDSMLAGAIISGGCGNYRFQWSPSIGLSSDTIKNPMILVDDTVTYTITVSDSFGHTATTSFLSTPLLIITITDTLPCLGCTKLSMNYTSYIGSGFTIRWYRNGTLISGANQTTYIPTLAGTYTVGLIDNSRYCILYSNPYNYSTVEISSQEFLSFTIYPNPAADHITLEGLNENAIVKLFDIVRKEVTSKIKAFYSNNETIINTSLLKPSLYFIDVECSGIHSRARLIIAR